MNLPGRVSSGRISPDIPEGKVAAFTVSPNPRATEDILIGNSLGLRFILARDGSGPLLSADITRLHQYYGPIRHLPPPTRTLTGPSLGTASRLPLETDFPCCAPFMLRACCHHQPGGIVGCVSRSLPRRLRPSPSLVRVGSHIGSFEACSVFTRVAARTSADPLKGPFLEVLQTIRRLLIWPECFRLEREFAGPDLKRGEWCTFTRHTQQRLRTGAQTCRYPAQTDQWLPRNVGGRGRGRHSHCRRHRKAARRHQHFPDHPQNRQRLTAEAGNRRGWAITVHLPSPAQRSTSFRCPQTRQQAKASWPSTGPISLFGHPFLTLRHFSPNQR